MVDGDGFRARVAAYEHVSRHAPKRFAMATAAMAVFGYAAILLALGLAVAGLYWGAQRLAHGHFHYTLLLLIGACVSLLFSLGTALWSSQAPLEGHRITRADAPRLFKLIDEVRRRCGGPAPDVVLIDGELNAAIVQQPRLGLLGWHRDTLILGLPLLMGLDTRQLAGVIAHEFGHFKGAHGKLGAWIYRTRRSWVKLALTRERARVQAGIADAALQLFFGAFFPRFNARAFVLARQQEYEADRVAHEVAGAPACAGGLIALTLQSRYLEECFWPRVHAGAAESPQPPAAPHAGMQAALRSALCHPDAGAWLRDGMKRLPDPADTHPSMRDRLEFAQVKPAIPAGARESAAEALLGDRLAGWVDRIDAAWCTGVAGAWAARHGQLKAQRKLAEELAAERLRAPLSAQDHLLWARAARSTGGAEAEVPVLRQLLDDHPGQGEARFELGMTLIGSADPEQASEGAGLLKAVAEDAAGPHAFAAGKRYERWLEAHERFGELKPWREKLAQVEAQSDVAWEALNDFADRPRFQPHGLGPRALLPLLDLLRRESAVGRAFLVRKTSHLANGWHFCIVIVERSSVLGQPSAQTWWEELRERIELPCLFMVIDLAYPFWKDAAQAGLVQQMIDVPGACIYSGRRLQR